MIEPVQVLWSPAGITMPSLGARALVDVTDGDTPNITIRETKKLGGELLTLDEMRRLYLQMESWSQIVYDRLTA